MTMCAGGLAKLLEELGELSQVAAKKLAYFEGDNHPDGSNLRLRLEEEMADVLAAMDFVMHKFRLDQPAIYARAQQKLDRFNAWDREDGNDEGFAAAIRHGVG